MKDYLPRYTNITKKISMTKCRFLDMIIAYAHVVNKHVLYRPHYQWHKNDIIMTTITKHVSFDL